MGVFSFEQEKKRIKLRNVINRKMNFLKIIGVIF